MAKKKLTQIEQLNELNGKLLEEMSRLTIKDGVGDGLKKNQIDLLSTLNQNIVKVQTYLANSQDTKDESLRAQAAAIRIRREEILIARKKKSQK